MKKSRIILYLSFLPYIVTILKILITGQHWGGSYVSGFDDLLWSNSYTWLCIFITCLSYQLFYFVVCTNINLKIKFIGFILSIIALILQVGVFVFVAIDSLNDVVVFLLLFSIYPILPSSLAYFISFIIFMNKSD